MRIAFTTPEYVTESRFDGGLANYLQKTCQELSRRGNDIQIFVASTRDKTWMDGTVKIIELDQSNNLLTFMSKVVFIRVFVPFLQQLITSRNIAKEVWSEHYSKKFDLIHTASYKATGFSLLKNNNIPVVCRVSSYTPSCRMAFGRKATFTDYLCDWLERKQLIESDACFSPSHLLANLLHKAQICFPKVVRTKIESIDIPSNIEFYNTHAPKKPYLIFWGTLSRVKGVDLIADVLPSIFLENPDLSMVFIGRDDGFPNGTKFVPYIKKQCKGSLERLQFHKPLSKDRLIPFIKNAIAAIIPSRIDNYPNVCIEAQVIGIPVVGTYNSSIEEIVINNRTGFLAENSNPASLKKAILKCINMTEDERIKMRANILEHIQDLVKDDSIGHLIALYKQTINEYQNDKK